MIKLSSDQGKISDSDVRKHFALKLLTYVKTAFSFVQDTDSWTVLGDDESKRFAVILSKEYDHNGRSKWIHHEFYGTCYEWPNPWESIVIVGNDNYVDEPESKQEGHALEWVQDGILREDPPVEDHLYSLSGISVQEIGGVVANKDSLMMFLGIDEHAGQKAEDPFDWLGLKPSLSLTLASARASASGQINKDFLVIISSTSHSSLEASLTYAAYDEDEHFIKVVTRKWTLGEKDLRFLDKLLGSYEASIMAANSIVLSSLASRILVSNRNSLIEKYIKNDLVETAKAMAKSKCNRPMIVEKDCQHQYLTFPLEVLEFQDEGSPFWTNFTSIEDWIVVFSSEQDPPEHFDRLSYIDQNGCMREECGGFDLVEIADHGGKKLCSYRSNKRSTK